MDKQTTQETLGAKRVPSVAAIHQHPLHPILVTFPLALLITAFGADLLYWWTDDAFFARASFWSIGAGVAGAAASIATGLIDFLSIRYAREQISGWSHMLAAIFTTSLAVGNFLTRWDDPIANALPWGALLSANTALMLVFTGWLGGNLTFRHLIGSYLEEEDRMVASEVKGASPSQEKRSR